MKKLFAKTFVLVIIVSAVNFAFNRCFYNKNLSNFWGDKSTLSKRNYLIKNGAKFNTIFIGSSKTKYQIDPDLFDQVINKKTDANINSFNLGIDGMMPPESLFLYKTLLKSDSLHIKTVILELDFIKNGDTRNLFTWRSYYWLNRHNYAQYTAALFSSGYPFGVKLWYFAVLNVMAAEKELNMGKFNEFVQFKKNQFLIDKSYIGEDGFLGLEHPKVFSTAELNDINNLKTYSLTAFSNYKTWSSFKKDQVFFNSYDQLIKLSNQKGIRVIVLLPIQWKLYQYKALFPILKSIPDSNKLIMADYNKYDTLFKAKYLCNYDHLDSVGAKIYTEDIARAFLKIYGKKENSAQAIKEN